MSVILKREERERPITGWDCGCRPEAKGISLSYKACPYCRRAIPETVCKRVYQQVLRELRKDMLVDEAERWERVAGRTQKLRNLYRVLTVLSVAAWIVLLYLVGASNVPAIVDKLPQLLQKFSAIGDGLSDAMLTFFAQFPEKLQPDRWAALYEKLDSLPVDTVLTRLVLLPETAVDMVGLTVTRCIDLFEMISSFVSSLLS
ncbi:MAG: hypothetical protein E7470_08760 [Ruminococcaceae bacterium]|nr:hypothetical protein [Oscillospiraceae bacterium]